jgi:hypothetical protein
MDKKWTMTNEFCALYETWMMVDDFHRLDENFKNELK